MPRPTLFDHPKFMRLCWELRMPEPHVLGHLEYLWKVAYQSGDAKIGDAVDVELAAKWIGIRTVPGSSGIRPGSSGEVPFTPSAEAGKFCAAALKAGFLDEKDGSFYIHDLVDHEPDYVKDRRRKERERRGKGALPRKSVLPLDENRDESTVGAQFSRTSPEVPGLSPEVPRKFPDKSGTPTPTPTQPYPPTPQISDAAFGAPSSAGVRASFEDFWKAYPKKKDRGHAEKIWKRLRADETALAVGAALEFAAAWAGASTERQQFVPLAATWLSGQRWTDDRAQWARDATGTNGNGHHKPEQPAKKPWTEADEARNNAILQKLKEPRPDPFDDPEIRQLREEKAAREQAAKETAA